MNRISCIIFDIDGTLTQTNELIFSTFNHVTQRYLGKTFSPGEIIAMFGPPEEVAIERLVGRERVGEALEEFYAYYEEHHPRMADAYAGIRELLAALRSRGLLLAVFTGKGRRTTLITLDMIGIRQFFDMIVTGSDVRHHKPSADGIRSVMAAFGLGPEEVLMVGDAVSDVQAAREAGVRIAAVLWDSYGRDSVMQMDVDYRFDNVAKFDAWLRENLSGARVG
jgi:HAD superfamily hydrolase (TIGR01509 family)